MPTVYYLAKSGQPVNNNKGGVFEGGAVQTFADGINKQIPVSGVNGVTTTHLDNRFDDPRYYGGLTIEEYTNQYNGRFS
jgi:hypothetical protein